MNVSNRTAPAAWVEDLARSDAEVERGEFVSSAGVHDELRRALASMRAGRLHEPESTGPATSDH